MKIDDLGNRIDELTIVYKSIKDPTYKYRFLLERIWDPIKPCATLILHNPSFADHQFNDPTITSIMNNLILQNFGSLKVVNTSAFIDTSNDLLYKQENYISQDNDIYVHRAVKKADAIILGWGEWNGSDKKIKKDRAKKILKYLQPFQSKVYCYGINKDKSPKHPLNIKPIDPLLLYKF